MTASEPVLRPPLIELAACAGGAIAAGYALQPALPQIERTLAGPCGALSLVAGAAPLGYMAGLWILPVLTGGRPPRQTMPLQALALALALAAAAVAPNSLWLSTAALAVGFFGTLAAQCVALAARLMPEARGRAVGTVAAGVSLGILLGRVAGGVLADRLGWRAMLLVFAGTAASMAGLLVARLPRLPAEADRHRLADAVLAAPRALAADSGLRRAAAAGGCWFAAFNLFWSALALHLAAPPLGAGPALAGAFGLLGLAGVPVARLAGQGSDRFGARAVLTGSLLVTGAGFLVALASGQAILGLIAATLLVDAGCFSAQAANQARVLARPSSTPGAAFGAYMVVYYAVGAIGAAAGPASFAWMGWIGPCAVGLALVVLALALLERA